METVPTHRGALRPRHRYGLLHALARLIVVTGFAVAGWLALSALSDTASAAQPGGAGQSDHPAGGRRAAPGEARGPAEARGTAAEGGLATVRHLTGDGTRPAGHLTAAVERDMRELGDDPVAYTTARGRDVLGDKDRAVRTVGDLAATGVHRLRPAVRAAAPIGLVPEVAGPRPALRDGLLTRAQAPGPVPLTAASAGSAARASGGAVTASHADARQGTVATADGRRHYGAEHRAPAAPGPVLPSGQDDPRSGALSGGHQLGPIADLRADRHAAAPPAPGTGLFHPSALADLAAPGGPAVVPD
ncbi:hypothetical protein AGRA3207_003714 [Actinomadura graeca]|uniref:Uncharacterized protein n=1 Tax=Actinomadura graeca TaxID=2750812 RepID=A0ABX8QV29_9ACTN|nr:hypothetical protein [Actinomadura graeca]QXJ22671.1 hypothetical protein AGRA3207_003714 [Actinomadura graeca]